jgi:hypothetical protein
MLDIEFNWYLAHQEDLLERYNGKYIVIKDKNVIGSYDTSLDALLGAKKEHEQGTFLIQLCTPGEKDYTGTFHSRVVFA